MSQKSSNKSKRRPPGEKPADGGKDADWGFDSDDGDPGVQKKLAVLLVVCLLAGFGFVFYQKFRILQEENAQAKSGESDDAGSVSGEGTATEDDLPVLGIASSTEPTPTPDSESPFYEVPPEPTTSPAVEESWTLTQAEVPQQSLAPTPIELPPMADSSVDSFDPFGDPGSDTSPPVESPVGAVPQQAEQAPVQFDEPGVASAATPVDASPFMLEDPPSPEPPAPSAEPTPVEEPAMFVFGEPETTPEPTEANSNEEPPSLSLEPLPQQMEPEPFESSEPAMPVAQESPPTNAPPAAQDEFDPFSFAEPQQTETATTPPPAEEPFPFIAPPAHDDLPPQAPSPVAVTQPPAWPFSESPNAADPPPQAAPQFNPQEPPMLTFGPSDPAPAPTNPSVQQSSSLSRPPNPFSIETTKPRPLVTSALSAQAVIGERELVVTQSDTFWSISQREYGTSRYFTALARYNRDKIPQPEKLRAGMTIRIPPPEVLESKFPELFRKQKARTGQISPVSGTSSPDSRPQPGLFIDSQLQLRYRVGKRDTLSSIAQQHLGRASRWTEIYDLNRDQMKSPSTVKIGMVLKLPADAGGVTVSPAGGFSR